MKDFKKQQRVQINTPGESHDKQVGTVTQASTTKVWVQLADVLWMYFHSEVDILD